MTPLAVANQAPGLGGASLPMAVVFDCDGVLVDSERLSCSAWLPVLARRGIAATLDEIRAFIGKSDRALVAHYEQQWGVRLGRAAVEEREQEYIQASRGVLRAFSGVRQVLLELRSRSVRIGVASSGTPTKIQFSLTETGLEDLLPLRCSSVEVQRGKPAPDLFLLALERLGAAPNDAVVVEDSLPGLEAAHRAGIRTLGFASSHPATELREAGATAVFDDYASFMSALERLRSISERDSRTF